MNNNLLSYLKKLYFFKNLNIHSTTGLILVLLLILFPFVVFGLMFSSIIGWLNDIFMLNRTEKVTKIISDKSQQKQLEEIKKQQELEIKFTKFNLPYQDPQGRYRIDFATPYYSGYLLVLIYKTDEKEKILAEVNSILEKVEKEIKIENITYVDMEQLNQ